MHQAVLASRTGARPNCAGQFFWWVITAAGPKFAMPRRARATIARSIQPAPPVLLFQIPAKGLRCCGSSVPENDGPPSMENGDFQRPLPSQAARQLLNSHHHLKTPRHGCQWREQSLAGFREIGCKADGNKPPAGAGRPAPWRSPEAFSRQARRVPLPQRVEMLRRFSLPACGQPAWQADRSAALFR